MKLPVVVSTVALLLLPPPGAMAQAPIDPPALPRFDLAGSLGSYAASESAPLSYGSWYGRSLGRSVAAGHYWTEHLKTEIEVGWTGRGELHAEHPDASFEARTYGSALHTFSTTTIAAAQRYQFGHNAMFHPNVAAGTSIEWVHHAGELGPLYSTNGGVLQPRQAIPPTTERRYNAFVSAGFKAYVTQRVFVRTDLRVGFRRELTHILVNTGLGMDF
jgi:hypothetical protein